MGSFPHNQNIRERNDKEVRKKGCSPSTVQSTGSLSPGLPLPLPAPCPFLTLVSKFEPPSAFPRPLPAWQFWGCWSPLCLRDNLVKPFSFYRQETKTQRGRELVQVALVLLLTLEEGHMTPELILSACKVLHQKFLYLVDFIEFFFILSLVIIHFIFFHNLYV